MMNLEQKYRQDKLAPKELKELRAKVNSTSDELLEDKMRNEWMHVCQYRQEWQRVYLLRR